ESALLPEDLDVLLLFGQSLGGSDREEQEKNLRLVKEQLSTLERKAEELKAKNKKLWQYLGFSMGAVIALILL
ncbi:MAG: stage III sporulation protein AB, partial [Peptococcales bacterium]